MTKSEAARVIKKLQGYKCLDLRGRPYDEVGWIAYCYSCARKRAESMIEQARKKLRPTRAT